MKKLMMLVGIATVLSSTAQGAVRIKDLGRIDGVRDNMIVGYGIVSGLAGTGDSSRNQATLQSIVNTLRQFGVVVTPSQLSGRNVAAVMVTATLPPYARVGDKLDVTVSSVGDARSLLGSALLMTPLYGPDKKLYALAQGPLSVGGYRYDVNNNVVQRNHPTTAIITEGATVETAVEAKIVSDRKSIDVLLFDPDHTTASRMAASINKEFGSEVSRAVDAGRVTIGLPADAADHLVDFVARVEGITLDPDQRGRVIVNERTGTVVSGGDVHLSAVTVTHGSLRVSIVTDYLVSQPGGVLVDPSPAIRTQTVPQTRVDVKEEGMSSVSLPSGTTVADLVSALNRIKTSTRDTISILQSIKRAGALHAELVVQ
jgi:flagellar P-ring protein precursor FlgI